jgi:ubiquinone/menaquinone biosynthesis C-methylase UbiE
MLNVHAYFNDKLVNLGEVSGEKFEGIYAPVGYLDQEKQGVTEQFLNDAETYHAMCFDPARERSRLNLNLSHIKPLSPTPLILDVGSGSGNTVFAMLDICPGARIVATDISEHMLAILRRELMQRNVSPDRVALVCADLHSINLVPKQFEFIHGGSVLHHLVDPVGALKRLSPGLAKNASAAFVEPFELCYSLLKAIWLTILADPRDGLGDKERKLLSALVEQFEQRKGADKTNLPSWYDDKWLFTREYFNSIAKAAGFSSIDVVPDGVDEFPFRIGTDSALKNLIGPDARLPDWAYQMIGRFDAAFSEEARQAFFGSGLVIARA